MSPQYYIFSVQLPYIADGHSLLCKNDYDRFTTVPWKAFSGKVWIRYQCFQFRKLIISIVISIKTSLCNEHFYLWEISELNNFKPRNK